MSPRVSDSCSCTGLPLMLFRKVPQEMFDSMASNEPDLPAVQGTFGRSVFINPSFFSFRKTITSTLSFQSFAGQISSDLPLNSYLIPHVVLSLDSLVNPQTCFTTMH